MFRGKQQGHVVVNTIPLTGDTRGVADNPYPWQGTYFRYLPIRLAAVPAPGFAFVRWESENQTFSDSILEVKPDRDRYFTAIFREEGVTGVDDLTVPEEEDQGILGEVYPNPFSGMATFRLKTGRSGEISVVLSDLQGRRIRQVYNGFVPSGSFTCPVDGTGLAPGIYFLECETASGVFRQKVVRTQPKVRTIWLMPAVVVDSAGRQFFL